MGRVKDVIIRGGENIYPIEVEEFLLTHPNVAEVHVVGVKDERMGEEVCAWVRLRDTALGLNAKTAKEFCSGKIAHFKVPRYVRVVEAFPLTVSGKVKKNVMRETSDQILKEGSEKLD